METLRGSQAAAPLKPPSRQRETRAERNSPRLTSRGPIEAGLEKFSLDAGVSLRGSQAAAPLKQFPFSHPPLGGPLSAAHKPRPH